MVFSFFPSDFNQVGGTTLHFSTDSGSKGKEKISLLVENGADIIAQARVSFNLNEKDKTDLSVYTKFIE